MSSAAAGTDTGTIHSETVSPRVRWSRLIFAAASIIFAAAVFIQVFLAGLALFAGASIDMHRTFARVFEITGLVLIVTAFLGRLPRNLIIASVALFGLLIVQGLLMYMRSASPVLPALHPVNAIALFWLASWIARQSLDFLPRAGSAAEG
ncbi:MAG: hypothetical protein H0X16_07545 [Chloroflexi bacterium]|nr:hypothetical protein [Chloroflexota bacterium]